MDCVIARVKELEKKEKEYYQMVIAKKKAIEITFRSVQTLRNAGMSVQSLSREAAVAHYNLGVLFMKQSQYKEAAQEFSRTLALNPNDALAHFNLALISDAYTDSPEDAIRHYEDYLRLLPTARDFKDVEYRLFQVRLRRDVGANKLT